MTVSSEKETKIVDAAFRLFSKYGPKKTTIDDVAKEAGLGKGTLYLYFKSKDEIFKAVVHRQMSQFLSLLRQAVRQGRTPEDKLERYLMTRLRFFDEFRAHSEISLEVIEETRFEPIIQELKQFFFEQERGILIDVLEEGVEQGRFAVSNVGLVALAISSTTDRLAEPWQLEGRNVKTEDKVSIILSLFFNGLLSPAARTALPPEAEVTR